MMLANRIRSTPPLSIAASLVTYWQKMRTDLHNKEELHGAVDGELFRTSDWPAVMALRSHANAGGQDGIRTSHERCRTHHGCLSESSIADGLDCWLSTVYSPRQTFEPVHHCEHSYRPQARRRNECLRHTEALTCYNISWAFRA